MQKSEAAPGMDHVIRNETADDYRQVEDVTRLAFWNVHRPGCDEHYLVHVMRGHPDFIPALAFVLECDGRIVGNIMYATSRLVDEHGGELRIATFGPVSILPGYQRRGLGHRLMTYSMNKASELGFPAIVIFGNPSNYTGVGFKSCKRYNITLDDGSFPAAMLVKELCPGHLDGRRWVFRESEVYAVAEDDSFHRFEASFPPLEKKVTPRQEEFFILSNARIV